MLEKVLLSWSGGKDSALALYEIKKRQDLRVHSLISTVTEDYDRISIHGVRRALLEIQAESLGISLHTIYISKDISDDEYGQKMRETLVEFSKLGVSSVVFGDIFLEDLKKFRENQLAKVGMKGIFPLWKRETRKLAQSFLGLGFRAVVTSVDSQMLDQRFVGRVVDENFLAELPPSVDACGENGEFHSFVFDGPLFKEEIPYEVGETVLRDNRFYYCDLKPLPSDNS